MNSLQMERRPQREDMKKAISLALFVKEKIIGFTFGFILFNDFLMLYSLPCGVSLLITSHSFLPLWVWLQSLVEIQVLQAWKEDYLQAVQ